MGKKLALKLSFTNITRLNRCPYLYPQVVAFQPNIIYQQDWAPPHWSVDVRGSLNATFSNRWIGRDGPICWSPCSSDLTSLDFFLWGNVKDRVFATPVNDTGEIRTGICDLIATITVKC